MNKERAIVIGVFAVLLIAAQVVSGSGSNFFRVETLLFLAALVPAVVLHEVAHGWLALRFGDQTAKLAKRLTLNPLRHVDPIGTVIVPLFLAWLGMPPFGWAKPVPVNVSQMSRNRQMFVSLIGPATNIVLALIAGLLFVGWFQLMAGGFGISDLLGQFLIALGLVNVSLAVFNALPIPPLDGSSVIERLIPTSKLSAYFQFRDKSIWILMIAVLILQMQFGFIFRVISPFHDLWLRLVENLSLMWFGG